MAGYRDEADPILAGGNGNWPGGPTADRRTWLRLASGAVAVIGGLGRGGGPAIASDPVKSSPVDEAEKEIQQAETLARKVTRHPLHAIRSVHYQAIGDASGTFIKLTLSDCEQIALDYRHH